MKPKLLVVSRNLPPLTGGMERLMQHLLVELAPIYDCYVIGPHGAAETLPANVKVYGVAHRFLPWFLGVSWFKALALSVRYRFRAVVAGNGLMTTVATAARLFRRPPLVTLVHGLDIVIDNRIYRCAVLPLVRKSSRLVANSANTAKLAGEIGVTPDRIIVLNPAVEMPRAEHFAEYENLNQLDGKRVLLSVGRIIRRKGLARFVDLAFPQILDSHPDTILVVAGDTPTVALRKEAPEMDAVLCAADKHRIRDHLIFLGRVDDATLHYLYRIGDVHVFPVRDLPGDVEGFGMVTLEAAARGMPTVAFRTGGVPDAIVEGENGVTVEPDDYQRFADAVRRYLDEFDKERIRARCIEVAAARSWTNYGRRFDQIIFEAQSR